MKFGNLRIGARLGAAFGLLLAALIGAAAAAMTQMADIDARFERVVHVNAEQIDSVNEMREAVMGVAIAVRNLALTAEKDLVKRELESVSRGAGNYAKAKERSSELLAREGASDERQKQLAGVVDAASAWLPLAHKVAEMAAANNTDTNDFLLERVLPAQIKLLDALDVFGRAEREDMKLAAADAEGAYHRAVWVLAAIAVVSAALCIFLAVLTTRSITKPIGEALHVARAVASGDLTVQVRAETTDEAGQLMAALNDMNAGLMRIVGRVRAGTQAISTASGQIASGNQDLSQRTEEQAASLEETAASIEQLTGTVKQNSENAQQANQLAQSASEVAAKGGVVVGQVVSTMDAINESSRKIADIISVIDGIAFQTNILALNAAVEAARAGEQGRGFAVVAAEVRTLAQRSAAAAKEIKTLINDSVGKVDAGATLVGEAGQTMSEIVQSIRRVTNIMGEIAAASQEQTRGIEQVNTAIAQMDQVTQQNAALVEEAAAATQSMREQSQALAQVVGSFKLDAAAERESSEPPQALPPMALANAAASRRVRGREAAPALGRAEEEAVAEGWREF